ncbi:MAG: SsrA-binding protein SmpB [Chloroflexi bacterium]|nr:SsrA-binding protein SmpB [Chloroflexota bacterium]
MAKKQAVKDRSKDRAIASNRRAFYNFEILDRYEAGMVLTGTEIKSIRAGRVDLADAYARPQDGELWLVNAYIAPYESASAYNHDPRRSRKLLLHKKEMANLIGSVREKGLTIVALRIYIRNHVAKVELALAKGKRQYDKRQAIINKELDMAARRSMGAVR